MGSTAALRAEVSLPPIFSEHMVLQRSATTPVWGSAAPGEEVVITLTAASGASATGSARAAADGHWRVDLDLSDSARVPSGTPLRFTAKAANTISFSDVLVGEVWLASGQSNMARTMAICAAEGEIANSSNEQIRFFTVRNKTSYTPLAEVQGAWVVASPKETPRFSAVAYYFARNVQAVIGAPVGVIHASWGGTPVDAWTSEEALLADPVVAKDTQSTIAAARDFAVTKAAWLVALHPWLAAVGREDIPATTEQIKEFALSPASADNGWAQVKMPGDLPGERTLWVRREVTVDASAAGKPLTLDFNEIKGIDTVYFDGVAVGGRTLESFDGEGMSRLNARRQYKVPANAVTIGAHTLAVRIYAPWVGDSGLSRGYFSAGSQNLTGDWLVKTERSFAPLSDVQRSSGPGRLKAPLRPWNVPGSLYNGMISGLVPYGLRGVIWYQGENDSGDPMRYRTTFPLLIQDWRQRWAAPDLAFYWCQLPNFGGKTTDANASAGWAGIREAQTMTLRLPDTGQAVIIDAGEAGDIHPKDKHLPGERLAAIALAKNYGRAGEYSGPVYDSMKLEGATIRVSFTHLGGGLVARPVQDDYLHTSTPTRVTKSLQRNSPDSQLEGFLVRGAPGERWQWADAKIEGDTVVVSSPKVPHPQSVRYDWSSNPNGNLYNASGFPACPFRTDNDPL